MAVVRHGLGGAAAEVTDVAATVDRGVGIEHLLPVAGARNADAVARAGLGGEVAADDDEIRGVAIAAKVGEDALVGVVAVDPLEAGRIAVELVQRRRVRVEPVQVAHQSLHALVGRPLQKIPLQALVVVPLVPLAELAAHEQQLLAGLGEQEAEEKAEVGEALPVVARHAREEGALAVHDLVVGERQDEVLVEGVEVAERQLVVVEPAEERIAAEVLQRVVHPAHVPLEAEAQTADVRRPRHHGPGGRLFGDRLRPRAGRVDLGVQPPQQVDRLQVLAASVAVGNPLPLAARVVAVEHRGHGIDPQSVGVVAVEPEERAADQEAPHLVAPVIEDVAAPVGVETFARVAVLVEMGAVEVTQTVGVGGEVRRHPVEDDADAALVESVDQGHEVLRRAEAARRREVAGRLVAPRAEERVLHHGKHLDVGEAQVGDVVAEVLGQLAVGEGAVALLDHATPRAEVHLVDRHRLLVRGSLGPALEPLAVVPAVVQGPDDRSRARRHLGVKGERIGLLGAGPVVAGVDVVLVEVSRPYPGDEPLPDTRGSARTQRVALAVPAVEVADHPHPERIRRPDGEVRPVDALRRQRMRSELLVEPEVTALVEQVQIVVRQQREAGAGGRDAISALPRHRANALQASRRMSTQGAALLPESGQGFRPR